MNHLLPSARRATRNKETRPVQAPSIPRSSRSSSSSSESSKGEASPPIFPAEDEPPAPLLRVVDDNDDGDSMPEDRHVNVQHPQHPHVRPRPSRSRSRSSSSSVSSNESDDVGDPGGAQEQQQREEELPSLLPHDMTAITSDSESKERRPPAAAVRKRRKRWASLREKERINVMGVEVSPIDDESDGEQRGLLGGHASDKRPPSFRKDDGADGDADDSSQDAEEDDERSAGDTDEGEEDDHKPLHEERDEEHNEYDDDRLTNPFAASVSGDGRPSLLPTNPFLPPPAPPAEGGSYWLQFHEQSEPPPTTAAAAAAVPDHATNSSPPQPPSDRESDREAPPMVVKYSPHLRRTTFPPFPPPIPLNGPPLTSLFSPPPLQLPRRSAPPLLNVLPSTYHHDSASLSDGKSPLSDLEYPLDGFPKSSPGDWKPATGVEGGDIAAGVCGGGEVSALRDLTARLKTTLPASLHIEAKDLVFTRKIGEGTFSEVFYGQWRSLEVAIKRLKTDTTLINADLLSSFFKEVRILAEVRSPNVVLLLGYACDWHDPETHEPRPFPELYLVTEYITGGNLHALIHQGRGQPSRPLPDREAVRIAIEICNGMIVLAHHRIVHGDLKPMNILIEQTPSLPSTAADNGNVTTTTSSSSIKAKIVDFGLSHTLSHCHSTSPNHLATAKEGGAGASVSVGGTLAYFPPEGFHGAGLSEASDVYAFGVNMWEMVMGQPPWLGLSPEEIPYRVGQQGERLPVPHTWRPSLRRLVAQCFASPADRPSFLAIKQSLIAILHEIESEEHESEGGEAGGPQEGRSEDN
ncbi:unnamed protein product [Vitrella brassicaformis CCMP3155]|uniref:Protein kinase domain-containing protein n=3 Tax=Vitrella brassicaformis TaxID=1169539 RepID=A0A0G4ELH7_VITBC|nr:unnamed protein product [Vitrella brassicaformis CCMP3155]|eukprot:CEL98268.1 unnamed protein product [Vitrella brassicaformis CCMP3155]